MDNRHADSGPLTVKQASPILGLSIGAIYDLVHRKKIGHFRMGASGGAIRFLQRHLDEYLKSCVIEPTTEDSGQQRDSRHQQSPATKHNRGETLAGFQHLKHRQRRRAAAETQQAVAGA